MNNTASLVEELSGIDERLVDGLLIDLELVSTDFVEMKLNDNY